jgi:hypothetical protein
VRCCGCGVLMLSRDAIDDGGSGVDVNNRMLVVLVVEALVMGRDGEWRWSLVAVSKGRWR